MYIEYCIPSRIYGEDANTLVLMDLSKGYDKATYNPMNHNS